MDEAQINYERLNVQNELFFKAVMEKFKVLPSICSLSATLLVVATFNENLLPLNNVVRVLLSILLFLIPTSLFFYLFELNDLANGAQQKGEEILGESSVYKANHPHYIRASTPWIIWFILSMVILLLIILIWSNSYSLSGQENLYPTVWLEGDGK